MADPITFQAAPDTFACGKDFTNITVVNFRGPARSKICAYSCNMNVDLDGDPQAYGAFANHKIKPLEYLVACR